MPGRAERHGRITVVQPGGERDGIGQRVSGVAELSSGERVVLFLERAGPLHRVVGLAQGVYRVHPGDGAGREPGPSPPPRRPGARRRRPAANPRRAPRSRSRRSAPRSRRRSSEARGCGPPVRAAARAVRPAVRPDQDQRRSRRALLPLAGQRRHPRAGDLRAEQHRRPEPWARAPSTPSPARRRPGRPSCRRAATSTWPRAPVLGLAVHRLRPGRAEREPGPLPHPPLLRRWSPPATRASAAGTCGNVYDCWDHSSSVVALTTSTYIPATGELVDADVELNAASAFPTIVDSPPCSPERPLHLLRRQRRPERDDTRVRALPRARPRARPDLDHVRQRAARRDLEAGAGLREQAVRLRRVSAGRVPRWTARRAPGPGARRPPAAAARGAPADSPPASPSCSPRSRRAGLAPCEPDPGSAVPPPDSTAPAGALTPEGGGRCGTGLASAVPDG